MDPDELDPKRKAMAPKNLDVMGIAELQGYIAELEAEILRVRTAIAGKQSVRTGAEALFTKAPLKP
jgi:uncharacterized small protein (DUF1192 family)